MSKLELLIEFIRNNKLLTMLVGVAILMMLSILFSRVNNIQLPVTDNQIQIEYLVLEQTTSFKFYIYQDKYYVLVKDINKSNKNVIRTTLGIPNGIDFSLEYLNVNRPTEPIGHATYPQE